ncbi:MAG: AraC family transcriptional regulator [Pseudomonadota bacterium]|nr:AraC family transcriptional regulator [Pseudomonadota bacterium]
MDQHDETCAAGDTPRRWDWRDVGANDAFAYYREGVCAAFMPLAADLGRDRRAGFRFAIASHDVGGSVLNHVRATSHTITKGRRELAASPADCYYLNLQLGGVCRIRQNGGEIALRRGDLGLFTSEAMELRHDEAPDLAVASLMVPKAALDDRFEARRARFNGRPEALSLNPNLGALATDSATALLTALTGGASERAARLHAILLDLTAEALTPDDTAPATRAAAHRARILTSLRQHANDPEFDLTACARATALTPRAIQRALSDTGDTFSALLTDTRLATARRLLADPARAHLPISTLAADAGFRDPSHFGRLFATHMGTSPGAWRKARTTRH